MEASEREQLLRARERPLRASGPERVEDCGASGSIDPEAGEIQQSGSREAKRPTLLIAMFNAGHAGRGRCWKSDHLEPFSLWDRRLRLSIPHHSSRYCGLFRNVALQESGKRTLQGNSRRFTSLQLLVLDLEDGQ